MNIKALFVVLFLHVSSSLCQTTVLPYDVGAVLANVNNYRALHRVGFVTWNDSLAKDAESWATYLASINTITHASTYYGENLYANSRMDKDGTWYIVDGINVWYNENTLYDYNKPGYSASTGHFTQLVWAGTKEIGSAVVRGSRYNIVVMRFNPPGTFISAFDKNVFPAFSSPPPPPPPIFASSPPPPPPPPVLSFIPPSPPPPSCCPCKCKCPLLG